MGETASAIAVAVAVAVFANVADIGHKKREAVKERQEAQPSTILSRSRCCC
jgi:hypothetical protein